MIKPRTQASFAFLLIISLISIAVFTKHIEWSYFLIGTMLGLFLNIYGFGFRRSSQQLLIKGQTLGVRVVLIMIAISSLLFFPLLGMGSIGNQPLVGFIQPISLSVIVGAFIFGVGMQFGNGCTSGTLSKLGQFHLLSFTGILSLLIGGVLAAYQLDFWRNLPSLPPYSLIENHGIFGGLLVQLSIITLIYLFFIDKEKKRHGYAEPLLQSTKLHPWLKAAIMLAIFNTTLLIVAGQPWSIANIFPIWGIKLIELLQLPIEWQFWSYSITYTSRIEESLLTDLVSLTTIGLIFGALIANIVDFKGLKFKESEIKISNHLLALIGGILMGYGSVIAYGCNIGALFSGISSGSLHGWVWAFTALSGNLIIIQIKKYYQK